MQHYKYQGLNPSPQDMDQNEYCSTFELVLLICLEE